MKINRTDLLKHLTESSSPKQTTEDTFNRVNLLESLQPRIKKDTTKLSALNEVRNSLQSRVDSNPMKGLMRPAVESVSKVWTAKTNVNNIVKRVLVEAALDARENPNAFRLDLQSIVMDKCHAKFSLKRMSAVAACELLYPNANNKITVKVSLDGSDDILQEIGLEDEQYVNNFGDYILQLVDELVSNGANGSAIGSNAPNKTQLMIGNKSGGMTGFGLWESDVSAFSNLMTIVEEVDVDGDAPIRYSVPGNKFTKSKKAQEPTWVVEAFPSINMESDSREFQKLMKIMEAEAPRGPADINSDDSNDDASMAGEGPADPALDGNGGDMGDVFGDAFGGDDFSMDGGANADMGDFSADFGGGFGGGAGGDVGGMDAGGINADEMGAPGGEEEEEFLDFKSKTDWIHSALDTMQKLTSTSVAQQMEKGTGVILTSDEILSGTQGIKNDMAGDIVAKFLKVYPELDMELSVTQLDEIEEKLSLDDGQFDSWLQQKLTEFNGSQDVDDALNNEMFMPFEPMGGDGADAGMEEPAMNPEPDTSEGAMPADTEFDGLLDDFSEESSTPEYKQAEADVLEPELNEFPNIDKGIAPRK